MKHRLLFICARNLWRSPTAETLFKNHPTCVARSAGTAAAARIRVTGCHLGWADEIFCMEREHARILRERFRVELTARPVPIHVLDIPDDFTRDDPELIAQLRVQLARWL
jgi:predicted protein tyrosine phosphatase